MLKTTLSESIVNNQQYICIYQIVLFSLLKLGTMFPRFATETCIENLLSDRKLHVIKHHLEEFGVDVKPAIVGYIVGGLSAALNYSVLTGENVIGVVVKAPIRYNGDWNEKVVESVKPLVEKKLKKCRVELAFFLRRKRFWKHDVDNLAATVLNSLKRAGVYRDDACVVQLLVSKHPTDGDEAVHIIIKKEE